MAIQVNSLHEDVTVTAKSERKYGCSWKVLLCCVIAAHPTLLAGTTISIPSPVALDLTENEMGLPPDFQLSTTDKSLFAVRSFTRTVTSNLTSVPILDCFYHRH